MADTAPPSQLANGGLFHFRVTGTGVLAWAFLISLVIHGLFLLELRILSGEARGQIAAPALRGELRQSRHVEIEAPVARVIAQAGPFGGAAKKPRPVLKKNGEAHQGPTPVSEQELTLETLAPAALSEYRLALARAARRLQAESTGATLRGQVGEVELVLVQNLGSPYPRIDVVRSSGDALLDERAMQLIGQAVKAVPLPADSGRSQFRIGLQVLFGASD